MRLETKVGLFITSGLIFLFGLTTQVNNFKLFNTKGYPVYAYIDSVDGLENNAKVKVNGMTIGSVESLELDKNKVIVRLTIFDDIKIPRDSIVSLKQESMLGVKYFNISFGDSSDLLKPNDYLFQSTKTASFDETSNSINDAAQDFRAFIKRFDTLIAQNQNNFTQMINNFKQLGSEFRQTGVLLNDRLPIVFDKFTKAEDNVIMAADKFALMSGEFKQTGEIINKDLPTVLTKFQKAEDNFNGIIEENRAGLKSAILNINNAFDNVDVAAKKVGNTFDKVDEYLTSTTQGQLEIGFRNEFMINDSYNKVYFGADYSPKPTTHYLIDLISSDDYRAGSSGTNIHEKGRTLVSAQYGKDFNNIRLRAGVTENTGGLGTDYFMNGNKLKASFDLFDFNAYNDARGKSPHAKAGLSYNYMKHINVYGGYDNFLNKNARNVTFGVGVNFVDQDLKYLLGTGSSFVK